MKQLGRTRWPTERSIQFVAANRPAQAKAKANPLGGGIRRNGWRSGLALPHPGILPGGTK